MSDVVVGMMFVHNEADILEETISNFLPHIDSLFIADDKSTDNSLEIIKSFSKHPKVEYVRTEREDPKDVGQRQSLLNEIRKRYKPENTWVQLLDADMMVLDTDIKSAIKTWAVSDIAMTWTLLNAARNPNTWKEIDTYPVWNNSIKEIMPYAHVLEDSHYTFRPLPKLQYNLDTWRPWPQGFSFYGLNLKKCRRPNSPLLAHYGYRGPTHFYKKYYGKTWMKYPTWKTFNKEDIEETVYFFNGVWNKELFSMSRDGWYEYKERERCQE